MKTQELRALLKQEKVDDATLNRFLVARDNNVQLAYEMISNYLKWRIDNKIDQIPRPDGKTVPYLCNVRKYMTIPDVNYSVDQPGIKPEFLKFQPHIGGGCFHGFDKSGQPIYIERLGHYDVRKFAQTCTAEAFTDFHVRNNEFQFNILMEEATRRRGHLIEKNTTIFDCSGMGIHQFHLPGIQLLKVLAELTSSLYPERLGKLFVINTPVFFTAAWAIIKKFLDKGTLDKIHILGSDYKTVLLKYISPDNLPQFLGGVCTCAHMDGGCVPSPGMKKIPGNPLAFRYSTALDKSYVTHQHEITIHKKGEIHYKFRAGSPIVFVIKKEAHVLYKSTTAAEAGIIPIPSKGVFTISWTMTKPSKLEYSLEAVGDSLSVGTNAAHGSVEADVPEIWYDAREFFYYFDLSK